MSKVAVKGVKKGGDGGLAKGTLCYGRMKKGVSRSVWGAEWEGTTGGSLEKRLKEGRGQQKQKKCASVRRLSLRQNGERFKKDRYEREARKRKVFDAALKNR